MEAASPTKSMKTASSPVKRGTLKLGASPLRRRGLSPSKREKVEEDDGKREGLSSPTSVSMQNSFIIKNADKSFDDYYQQMRKRKQAGQGTTFSQTNEAH